MASKRKDILLKPKSLSGSRRKLSLLCALPLELIEAVASFLDVTDMCAFRLTCKTLQQETSSIFWRTALHNMETDIFLGSLWKLQVISRNPQFNRCIQHLTIRAFDLNEIIRGRKFLWERRGSDYLANLHNHPVVKQLCDIYCNLTNCTSIEIYSPTTEILSEFLRGFYEPIDAIPIILEVISQTGRPVTSLVLNFVREGCTDRYFPYPKCLPIPRESQLIAVGAYLEHLTLRYTHYYDIVHDWAVSLFRHSRNLRTLRLKSCEGFRGLSFFHSLAVLHVAWPELREFRLDSTSTAVDDLITVLRGSQQSLRVLRLYGSSILSSKEDLQQLFQTLSTDFPMLQEVHFGELWSGMAMQNYVHFPGVLQNPAVGELQGSCFGFQTRYYERADRVSNVKYCGPNVAIALVFLAEAVDLLPKPPFRQRVRRNRRGPSSRWTAVPVIYLLE